MGRRIDEIYLLHDEALHKVNLINYFPTMGEFLLEIEKKRKKKDKKIDLDELNISETNNLPCERMTTTRTKSSCQTLFCIEFSDVWQRNPIHVTQKNEE